MARTNFKYEKRQKELAKQQKAEAKRLRRLEKCNPAIGENEPDAASPDAASPDTLSDETTSPNDDTDTTGR